jgi:hypothetical protein
VFLGGSSGITSANVEAAATLIESNQTNSFLGWGVGGAGDVNGDGYDDVIVGAPDYSDGETHEGAAFLFLGSASGIDDGDPTSAAAGFQANQEDARLGYGVDGAGDVNGDGYDDLLLGAPGYSNGSTSEGTVLLFLGGGSGITGGDPTTASARFEANQGFAFMGYSVAEAGDVNADGYGDVVLGAHFWGDDHAHEGGAFVFHGGASGISSGDPTTADAVLDSNQDDAYLGYGVAGAGDVNDDGYDDVIAGAFRYDSGEGVGEGGAFVFLGGASGVTGGGPADAFARLAPAQAGAWFGIAVAGVGDVNGDGYGDAAVGAPLYDAGAAEEGAAFLYLGGPASVDIPAAGPSGLAALMTLLCVSALLALRGRRR